MNYREQARELISNRIANLTCGYGLEDIADTPTVANAIEDVANLLEVGLWIDTSRTIREWADEILSEEGFPFFP